MRWLVLLCIFPTWAFAQPTGGGLPTGQANQWNAQQYFSYPTRFGAGPSGITYTGPSTPTVGLAGIFATATVTGFANDGGQPALNYFRTNTTTTGIGDFGYRFWEDIGNGVGGHAAVEVNAGNDNFSSYTIPAWLTGTAYSQGQIVVVGYYAMRATNSGTSGAVTPTCSSSVATCSDGTVSWHYWTNIGYTQTIVGLTVVANGTVGWGGTSSGPIGQTYGVNFLATCAQPHTVYCIGEELDFGIPAGSSSETRGGSQIVIEPGSLAGSVEDFGLRFASQGSNAAGLANIITFGSQTSDTPISSTGYAQQVYSVGGGSTTPTMMSGAGFIDALEFNPGSTGPFGAGFILRGPGSQILGNGDIQSNYALLHTTATGASLDVSEYKVTAVAVTGGSSGTGWTCTGKWARGSDGTLVSVDTISGGAVTHVTLVSGATSTTTTSTATFTAEQPRNCGAISTTGTGGIPSTFSVNETWTQINSGAPVLALGGVADAVAGTQAALATNATQGFLGVPFSNGTPTGTPTNNAVGAMIDVNTTSKTLNIYIPGVGWYRVALSAGAG